MSRARPIPPPLRVVTAGLLAVLILAVSTLVHLPALHRALHGETGTAENHRHDHSAAAAGDRTEGACAVALFAQGIATPSFDVLAPRPEEKPVDAIRLLTSAAPRVAPAHRHPPSQAPPGQAAL